MGRLLWSPLVSQRFTCKLPVGVRSLAYRNFRLIYRHNGGQRTDAKTSHDTADHHHGHVESKGLQTTTDEEDGGAVKNCPTTTDDIAYAAYQQRRDEGTDFENSYHGSDGRWRRLAKVISEKNATVIES